VLLILIGLGLAIVGIIRLGRDLTPGQRVVLVAVFILGVVWLLLSLLNAGLLGRRTTGPGPRSSRTSASSA
jgi:hypothetical protein